MATKKKSSTTARSIKKKKTAQNAVVANDSIFMYLGPSIRGFVQNGSIYRGTRQKVCAILASAIEKFPEVEKLIFEDKDVSAVMKQIKSKGNYLNKLCSDIVAKSKTD